MDLIQCFRMFSEYPLEVQIWFLDWLFGEGFSTFLSERFSFSQIFCPLRAGEADAEDEDRIVTWELGYLAEASHGLFPLLAFEHLRWI